MKLKYTKIRPNALPPEYKSKGAAGFDIGICIPLMGDSIGPGETRIIPTGLSFEVPQGYFLQLTCRSSTGKQGLIIPNGVGVIDSDYRGEVHVILHNLTQNNIVLTNGMRLIQGLVLKVNQVDLVDVLILSETARGMRGLGSTGI